MVANANEAPLEAINSSSIAEHSNAPPPSECESCRKLHFEMHSTVMKINEKLDRLALRVEELLANSYYQRQNSGDDLQYPTTPASKISKATGIRMFNFYLFVCIIK